MHPYICFLGSRLPTYSICAMMGLLAATFVLIAALYSRGLVRKYAALAYIALPGVILGGKLFSAISATLADLYSGGGIDLAGNIKQGGNVYYGGLLGYLALLCLLCKLGSRDFNELAGPIAISIPLFHSFGRIGCFFAGCCYGIESVLWCAVPYRIGEGDEAARRIPVQLIEAGYELCLCGVLCMLFWWGPRTKRLRLLELYLAAYALFRFAIEFLRGDAIRGVYGFLSFSQIISLMLVAGIACRHVHHALIRQ